MLWPWIRREKHYVVCTREDVKSLTLEQGVEEGSTGSAEPIEESRDSQPVGASADPQADGFDWRKVALQAAGMWLVTRIVFVVFTYIAVIFTTQGFDPIKMGLGPSFFPDELLQSWNKWDTGWYMPISNTGYEPDPQRAAFYPLYPLLIHGVTIGTGNEPRLLVALIIGNLGALLGYIGLALVTARELGLRFVPFVLLVFSAYPFSFFTAAAYPDGLFLGLAVLSIYFARRGGWYASAGLALLAGLARPTGIILALPLAWEFARQHGVFSGEWKKMWSLRSVAQGAAIVLAVPVANALFALHLGLVFGNPFLFLEVEASWAHTFVPLWEIPALAWNSITAQLEWSFNQARVIIDVAAIPVFFVLTLASVKRLPVSFTIYLASALVLSFTSPLATYFDPFASVGRYLIAAFPAFLLLGKWSAERAWLNTLVMSGGWMLQAVFATFFLMGGWMV